MFEVLQSLATCVAVGFHDEAPRLNIQAKRLATWVRAIKGHIWPGTDHKISCGNTSPQASRWRFAQACTPVMRAVRSDTSCSMVVSLETELVAGILMKDTRTRCGLDPDHSPCRLDLWPHEPLCRPRCNMHAGRYDHQQGMKKNERGRTGLPRSQIGSYSCPVQ